MCGSWLGTWARRARSRRPTPRAARRRWSAGSAHVHGSRTETRSTSRSTRTACTCSTSKAAKESMRRRKQLEGAQGMRYGTVLATLAAVLAFAAAGCGGDDNGGGGAKGSEDVSGSVSVMAIWAGEEQKSFQEVINGFEDKYPNVDVKYTSGGDNL